MHYVTHQDLADRIGSEELTQLADRDGSGVSSDVIERAITDAESTIDSYLGGRYQVPLATVPTVIKRIAVDLARYYLYDDHAPEQIRTRRDEAVRFLRDVSAGRVSLGVSEQGEPAKPADNAEISSGGRTFDRDGGGSFI